MTVELATLTLPELASRLRDVHTTRTPLGWPTDSAVTKSSIERRIIELVTRHASSDGHDPPAERVPCEIDVVLTPEGRTAIKEEATELRVGALFVPTRSAFTVSEPVEVEVVSENDYRVRVRGTVSWIAHGKDGEPPGIGIGFQSVVGDAAERRLERLVLEMVRNRLNP